MVRLGLPIHAARRTRAVRVALLALPALALLAGAWLWFRDSSFAAVRSVQISGVAGPGAGAIELALRREATRMSTLDVNVGALRAAVASYPQVRGVSAHASFPHELRIAVLEQPAVAILQATDGARTAAAANGVILGGALAVGRLAMIPVPSVPAKRVKGAAVLEYLAVLGAVPAPLADVVWRAYNGPKGLTVEMRNGMLVLFGDTTRAHAKWLSFARVLVAEGAASASYVDVRLPERPVVAGGAAASTSSSASGSTAANGASLTSSAALAAGLEATINGGGTTQPPPQAPSGNGAAAAGEAASGEAGGAREAPANGAGATGAEAAATPAEAPAAPASGG
jgi:cell division septal protein FtsQ